MKKQLKHSLLFAGVALLTACGGGDDDPVVVSPPTPVLQSFTAGTSEPYTAPVAFVNTAPPPAATVSPTVGASNSGNLNTRYFESDGGSAVATAIVNYTGPAGLVTVPLAIGEVKVSTADDYENVSWSYTPTGGSETSIGGTLKADGNIGVACLDSTFKGGRLFVSSNMKQAESSTEIAAAVKGLSFSETSCDGEISTVTFNNDGTMNVTSPGGGETFNASQVQQLFSATGLTISSDEGDEKIILRLYQHTPVGSSVTRYYVGIFSDSGTTGLLVQK